MNEICDWFTECVNPRTNTITFTFSDGTEKNVKRGQYLLNIEDDIRKTLEYNILNELYAKYEYEIKKSNKTEKQRKHKFFSKMVKVLKTLFFIISIILAIVTVIFMIIASSMPKTVFNIYNIYAIGTGAVGGIFYILFLMLDNKD